MIKKEFGVMQGRLLPKYNNRYQAHPLGYWQDEFKIASELGISYIEFILDYEDFLLNPLMSNSGINEIIRIIQDSGVGVRTVCADIFMEAPLHSKDEFVVDNSIKILLDLITNASKIGITDIVIPCVDKSSLKNELDQSRLISNLKRPLELALKSNINLALETDLSPLSFSKLISQIDSDAIKVNYDLGNSASLGYNIEEEFKLYGNKISDIHIKDREFEGNSVVLGSGNANFKTFFKLLAEINFNGPLVMQAFRDDEGITIFKEQFDWIKKQINNEFDSYYSC
ncbi:MAG: hypothetical protein RL621_883 [Bacteroidota bacterium]|jgi:L-ribulose-5-phosphate 3-epimerase UlaE